MISFNKTLYTDESFSFDDLQDINFDLYATDDGNQYGFYDITLDLLPLQINNNFAWDLEKGKKYIFSFYNYTKITGPQTKKFKLRISIGGTCYYEDVGGEIIDKNGIEYPEGVRRFSAVYTFNSSYEKIQIRLINREFGIDPFGCKTKDGEEPYLHPNGYAANFYAYGFQLEEWKGDPKPSDYSPANIDNGSKDLLANTSQSFQYFIYRLYGIPGGFAEAGNFKFFKESDTSLKEKRRLECGSVPCFQTYSDSIPNYFAANKFNIYKYKNVIYNQSDIFKFFTSEIEPYLSNVSDNFPKLFTDFDKLYFIGQMYDIDGNKQGPLQYKTYEKTDSRHSSAIIEIIRLLDKYKSFDDEIFEWGDERSSYSIPISFPGISHTPIKDEDFDDILFTGYLNTPVDLNIQAGFCRHYLNPEDPKPKISGYFYETSNFFDVKNTDLMTTFNGYRSIFPFQIELINQRPSFFISDTRKLKFTRLIKNDSSVNFVKILNYTGYVGDCYYKELKKDVSVELTGNYITSRRLSDVWTIQIKNTQDATTNDVELGITDMGVKQWTFKNFGPIKNSISNSKYLKIIHKNIQVDNRFLIDTATVELKTTSNGIQYESIAKVL